MGKTFLYISSWAEHGGKPGLGLYEFDTANGKLQFIEMADDKESFNCSVVDNRNNRMYVCNEVTHVSGEAAETGRIFTYSIDQASGKIGEVDRRVTYCPNPAWLSFTKDRTRMLVAHHSQFNAIAGHERSAGKGFRTELTWNEADVQLYRLNEDGKPGDLLDNINHMDYQERGSMGAHPHCAVLSPSEKIIAVADKGSGYLYLYGLSEDRNSLLLLNKQMTDVPGAAPRYCLFHPTAPFLFVNHEKEISGKLNVTAFRYDEQGSLERICVRNALSDGRVINSDIHNEQQGFCMSPDGKYLYTLLNGPDAVAVFEVDETSGRIELLQNAAVKGIRPRGLSISPDGKYVLTSCLVSGDIGVYAVRKDGTLECIHECAAVQKGASYMSFFEGKQPAF
ncbi:MAG: lactonase family protein [Lachnospiraceae bacterium]|jgi:6-phosphogluconolactonase|nr:lactonase family protein [Lachnospiraceae bacterium]